MKTTLFITGAGLMALSIILGAMGAHYLEKFLAAEQLASYETGVRYMVYHAIAMLVLSHTSFLEEGALKVAYILMLLGVILFSFSIYGLALRPLHQLKVSFLGPVTPLGGLLLIASWVYIIIKAITTSR